jgi:hypothetical protein
MNKNSFLVHITPVRALLIRVGSSVFASSAYEELDLLGFSFFFYSPFDGLSFMMKRE